MPVEISRCSYPAIAGVAQSTDEVANKGQPNLRIQHAGTFKHLSFSSMTKARISPHEDLFGCREQFLAEKEYSSGRSLAW